MNEPHVELINKTLESKQKAEFTWGKQFKKNLLKLGKK